MTALYLIEPEPAAAWAPFQDGRPVAEMRAGAWLLRERWEAIADAAAAGIFGPPHLHDFVEDGVPPVSARRRVEGPAVIGRSDFAPSGVRPELPAKPARLVNDGVTVGWWIPAGASWDADAGGEAEVEVDGLLLYGAFDLLTALEHLLAADVADFTHEGGDAIPDGSVLIGDPHEVVILGAQVEPGVVFDVRHGAVVLEQHVYVKSGTRLEGPIYVGPGTEVLGGSLSHCSIGPRCKARGEMHSVVFAGYANKAHDGFVGHSVLGRWVNLGAGTVTSNLKNTYGAVTLRVGEDRVETGRQNVGSLIGDHAKVAIGTLFDTGTVVGIGANVFGATRPPRYVPPFAWGLEGDRMTEDGFLKVASRVLPRRRVELTDTVRLSLTQLYRHATR
jgi:UDP-N-acetylglucosamine diphosphorylase/glucosamine-1-phosphate N-acetyltransferase